MTEDQWTPFGLDDDEAERYRVLVDGVPRRLREPLLAWMEHALTDGKAVRSARTRELEMISDVPVGLPQEHFYFWTDYLNTILRPLSEQRLLRVVDSILAIAWWGLRTHELDTILGLSRSKWTVGERASGKLGLVARQPEGVQEMVESAIDSSGTAGQILARAWGKVHALEPDDSGAYAYAVRAVEAAARPLVEPQNSEATLGSLASVMRSHGDWRLPLREHQYAPTADMVVAMMRSLYRGHADRHGNDNYQDVTHDEAQAGVALAATLVSWFASGAVQRRAAVT